MVTPFQYNYGSSHLRKKGTDDPRKMEQSTNIFCDDQQNNELICYRKMLPCSLVASDFQIINGGDKDFQELSYTQPALVANSHHLGCTCSKLVPRMFVFTDPRWRQLLALPQKVCHLFFLLCIHSFVKY